jgi:hypothetical protein
MRNTVEGVPLIFYHFHQFQLLDNGSFDRLSTFYTSECAEPADVYEAYEAELKQCLAHVHAIVPDFRRGLKPTQTVFFRRLAQKYAPNVVKNIARYFIKM